MNLLASAFTSADVFVPLARSMSLAEVTALVEKRAAAKKAKDWATADAIRAELTAMGWAVKDTAQGPQLSKL